jgi:hypothetical protein
MKTLRDKFKKMAEGFSPIYKDGKITPETRNLGPEFYKDIKWQRMEGTKSDKDLQMLKRIEKKRYFPKNFKNLA